MDARKRAIFVFQFAKPILQTITHLMQEVVLEIHFWSVKCMTDTVRYVKMLMQAIALVRLFEKNPLQNAFKQI